MLIGDKYALTERPGHDLLMVCYSAKDEEKVIELVQGVDECLRGSFNCDLDIWMFKALPSGVPLKAEIRKRVDNALAGLCMLSTSFLASSECREELTSFLEREIAILIKLRPIPNTHPLYEGITKGYTVKPYGSDNYYTKCKTDEQVFEFVQMVCLDILGHCDLQSI